MQAHKNARAPCRNRPEAIGNLVHRPQKFGYVFTADHQVLNEDNYSRLQRRHAVVVQDFNTNWIHSNPAEKLRTRRDDKTFTKVRSTSTRSESRYQSHSLIRWSLVALVKICVWYSGGEK